MPELRMHWLDWALVWGTFAAVVIIAVWARRYTRSVSDFLAAGRTARRYLLTISTGAAGHAAIQIMANFEMYYEAGFVPAWWSLLMGPAVMLIFMTGWVVYRYRQTRAMTLAQFFEMRYSKRFRVFSGIVSFVTGVVNLGLFPLVGARFFIHFCGLPERLMIGGASVPTMAVILAVLIGLSLYLTFGGQITIILTDFFQGTLSNIAFLIILGFLLWRFDWSTIISAASSAPAGESLLDPFDTTKVANFNIWYFLIQIVLVMYGTMAWQGSQAYNASAATPHESVMGRVLGAWRDSAYGLVMMLLPLCAWVVLHHADFGAQAGVINGALDEIGRIEQGHLKTQMTVPVALSVILPLGIKGLMCAVMFCGFVGNLEVSLHSWGSIFVQDVVLPFRQAALSPRAHIWLLRAAILGVALFIFVFSLVFRQTEHILMFFAITGAIYLSGAGAAIIGGLYWKYGSTAGAWGAMLLGMVLAVGTMVWRQVLELSLMPGRGLSRWLGVETVESLKAHTPNSQWMALIAAGASCALYVALSLRRPRAFNLDRMLHRGAYADADTPAPQEKPKRWFGFRVGQDFSFSDKLIYASTSVWTLLWFILAVGGTAYGSFYSIDTRVWSGFWHVKIWIGFVLGIVVTLAITVGGLGDVRFMLNKLKTMKRDHTDDGRVEGSVDPAPIKSERESVSTRTASASLSAPQRPS